MSINLGLLGQTFTFLVFIWFTMKFVWPPLETALDKRKKAIEDGLAQAELAKKQLSDAEGAVKEQLMQSRKEGAVIIEQAKAMSNKIVQDAAGAGEKLKNEIIKSGEDRLLLEVKKAKEELREQVASLVILGMKKILEGDFDESKHRAMLMKLGEKIQ